MQETPKARRIVATIDDRVTLPAWLDAILTAGLILFAVVVVFVVFLSALS